MNTLGCSIVFRAEVTWIVSWKKSVSNPSITNVLILLVENYAVKADGRQGGVGAETQIKRHSLKHSHVYSISRKRMIHKAFSRFSLLYLFVTSLKCLTELSPNCPHNNGESLSNKTDYYSSQQINDIITIISSRCIWHYKTCIPFSPQSTDFYMKILDQETRLSKAAKEVRRLIGEWN